MSDRPIIFSGPMVRAILAGRKTQTRRVMPDQSLINSSGQIWTGFMGWQSIEWAIENRGACGRGVMPKYWIGDRIWVRETFRYIKGTGSHNWDGARQMCADGLVKYGGWVSAEKWGEIDPSNRWQSPRHMPRWASRLTLIVEDVRVQRLQEINRGDAMAEGCPFANMADGLNPRDWFIDLWNSLNAKRGYAWDTNPWVVALTFRAIQKNIDEVKADA